MVLPSPTHSTTIASPGPDSESGSSASWLNTSASTFIPKRVTIKSLDGREVDFGAWRRDALASPIVESNSPSIHQTHQKGTPVVRKEALKAKKKRLAKEKKRSAEEEERRSTEEKEKRSAEKVKVRKAEEEKAAEEKTGRGKCSCYSSFYLGYSKAYRGLRSPQDQLCRHPPADISAGFDVRFQTHPQWIHYG